MLGRTSAVAVKVPRERVIMKNLFNFSITLYPPKNVSREHANISVVPMKEASSEIEKMLPAIPAVVIAIAAVIIVIMGACNRIKRPTTGFPNVFW